MLTFLRRLLIVLLPVVCFAGLLLPVRILMGQEGQGSTAIALFLGGLALLALTEGLLFRFWLLPKLGESIGEKVYGGSYIPEEDALVCLVRKVRETRDADLLPTLRAIVEAHPRRVRGWLELARVQQDIFNDPRSALQTLLDGEHRIRDKEECAMLLVRAAQLCENSLHDPAAAREHYAAAAERYPRTVYGKRAAQSS